MAALFHFLRDDFSLWHISTIDKILNRNSIGMYLLNILQAPYIHELLERFNETKINDDNFFAKIIEKIV